MKRNKTIYESGQDRNASNWNASNWNTTKQLAAIKQTEGVRRVLEKGRNDDLEAERLRMKNITNQQRRKQIYESGQIVAVILAVIGVLLNNAKIRWCFPLWFISSSICLYYHAKTKLWGLVARDIIFIILAVAGWIQWSYL